MLDQVVTDDYALYNGDSVEVLQGIPDDSVDLSIYSPPFMSLYTYSPSDRDVGNSGSDEEFLAHYRFIIAELYRTAKPGRNTCVHTADVPTMLGRDGVIGLKDFPGLVIQEYTKAGWIYHGRVTIDKNPQPLRHGTRVLTPKGWTSVERIEIGDCVVGSGGAPTVVTDVPYRGTQPMYRLTFDDGAMVECGPGHLWTVRTSAMNPWQTLTTAEMSEKGAFTPAGKYRWEVPIVAPVQFGENVDLPVHPRLLGALLADGNWAGQRAVSVTKDRELVERLPLTIGHHLSERPGSSKAGGRTATFGVVGDRWNHNEVLSGLRELGIGDCRAWEKFIPDIYLTASVEQRRELLSGLMDGDGKIRPNGGIYYLTTSDRLAAGIVELVNSLGGLATARLNEGGRYGDDQQGRPLWTIGIRITGDWCPFTLERKARYWKIGRRGIMRKITSIESTGENAQCTCISVSAEDGLFVTDSYVLTHNSQALRTHSKGLLFSQMEKDSSWSRPALGDYILVFRKPGENAVPIKPDVTRQEWILWARAVWYAADYTPGSFDGGGDQTRKSGETNNLYGIRETDTLQYRSARDNDDERHICPLQLGTIERCVRLWSNKGETVLSPFAGIGSEGYQALKLGRKFIGIELKESYYRTAAKNLDRALRSDSNQLTIFEALEQQASTD